MTKIQRENRKERDSRFCNNSLLSLAKITISHVVSSSVSFYRTNVSASAHKSCILRNCWKDTYQKLVILKQKNAHKLTVSSQLSSARSSFNMRVVSNPGEFFFRLSTTSEQTLNNFCFWWWSLWYNWAKREHFEHTPKFWKTDLLHWFMYGLWLWILLCSLMLFLKEVLTWVYLGGKVAQTFAPLTRISHDRIRHIWHPRKSIDLKRFDFPKVFNLLPLRPQLRGHLDKAKYSKLVGISKSTRLHSWLCLFLAK